MEFNIRKNAMKLLAHIYQNCGTALKVDNLKIDSILFNKDDRWQSYTYLSKSGYVSGFQQQDHPNMTVISCAITPLGINAVEDYFATSEGKV